MVFDKQPRHHLLDNPNPNEGTTFVTETEFKLIAATDRLEKGIDSLPSFISFTDTEANIISINQPLADFYHSLNPQQSSNPANYAHRPSADVISSSNLGTVRNAAASITPENRFATITIPYNTASGEQCWLGWTIGGMYDSQGKLIGYSLIGAEITEKLHQEKKLQSDATHDILTGFYNRNIYDVERETENFRRPPGPNKIYSPRGVFMIDIDRLKVINDTLGHLNGDLLIEKAAEVMRKTFREEDLIIRIGGDEFVVVGDLTPDEAQIIINDRLMKEINLANEADSSLPKLSMSVGFSPIDLKEVDKRFDKAVKLADQKMYLMKKQHHAQNGLQP